MIIRTSVLMSVMAGVVGFAANSAHAAVLNNGDQLTITPGQVFLGCSACDYYGGSYFAMDNNGNKKIATFEKVELSPGTTGLVVGTATSAGASHSGGVTAGDINAITAPWSFFGNTGSDYVTVPVTGGTTTGLNMIGWTVTWSGIPAIPMGTGAWVTGTGTGHTGATGTFTDGIANFYWSGVYGEAYSMDYRATVPSGDPSGFGGVLYELHLEGVVNAAPSVPVPAAAWLFGSGLLGLLGIARRRRAV